MRDCSTVQGYASCDFCPISVQIHLPVANINSEKPFMKRNSTVFIVRTSVSAVSVHV